MRAEDTEYVPWPAELKVMFVYCGMDETCDSEGKML